MVATVSMLLLSACGNVSENAMTHDAVTRVPEMSEAAAEATRTAGTPGAGGGAAVPAGEVAQEVTITMHDIFFEPKDFSIPANTNVKIILPNEGAAAHNFSIPDMDISVDVAPGETKDVVVNLPAGEYSFDCDVPGHKEAGMIGTLTVEEGAGGAAPAADGTPAAGEATPVAAGDATPVAADAMAGHDMGATPAAETAPAADAVAAPADVTIVSHDIYFDPKEMTIPANTDVKIILPNDGVTMHDFSIDELNIQQDIQPGETQEITINAPAGTYEFYCNVPGHKEAGMIGTLTVVEGAAAPAADAPADATAEQPATTEEASPAAAEAAAPATAEAAAEEASPAAEEAAAPAAAADSMTVVSHDIYFDPKEMTIPANTDVTIILPNEGVTTHDFSIDELDIQQDIAPGATEQVVINAPAGTYEYYCNIPGHKAAGMVGTLTVK
ncbi:MAG: cupredoxin domain-containing protein [Thermomicrobiales bacterium]